jgi:hypothetical protein
VRIAVALIFLLALTNAAAASNLTTSQIKTQIIGKTMAWDNHEGTGTVVFNKDGTSAMTLVNSPVASASGTWKLKGAQMCVNWPTLNPPYCFSVANVSPGKFRTSSGVDWTAQ